jgi:hypothetical protein
LENVVLLKSIDADKDKGKIVLRSKKVRTSEFFADSSKDILNILGFDFLLFNTLQNQVEHCVFQKE